MDHTWCLLLARIELIALQRRPGFWRLTNIVHVIEKAVDSARDKASYGLEFISLDLNMILLAAFAGASFAFNKDTTSQPGFFKSWRVSLSHQVSFTKYSLNTRGNPECYYLQTFCPCVHIWHCIYSPHDIDYVCKKYSHDTLHWFRVMYEVVIRINSTAEKRLLNNCIVLCKACELHKIANGVRNLSADNPAE